MIEITDKTVGMWYLQLTSTSDWLAAVTEIEPGKYNLMYRVRYYTAGPDPDAPDKKNWYSATIKQGITLEKMLTLVRTAAEGLIKLGAIGKTYELLMKDYPNADAFTEAWIQFPFVHAKTVTKTGHVKSTTTSKAGSVQ